MGGCIGSGGGVGGDRERRSRSRSNKRPNFRPSQAPQLQRQQGNSESLPEYYTISLDRTGGQKLGIRTGSRDGQTLHIDHIFEDALVSAWNIANPGNVVRAGDCIVEVNGFMDEAWQLSNECKENKVLQIRLLKGNGLAMKASDGAKWPFPPAPSS